MWGFSFDDLARRAQQEAAKLAEQAQDAAASMQSPSLFNLDSMNPESTSQNAPSTVQPAPSIFGSSDNNYSNINTAPPAYNSRVMPEGEGNVDHVSALVNDVASPRAANAVPIHTSANTILDGSKTTVGSNKKKEKIAVTKLSTVSAAGTDDFFDSWGDNDDSGGANSTNVEWGQEELQPVDDVAVYSLDATRVEDGIEKRQVVVHEEQTEANAWEEEEDFEVPDHDEPMAQEASPKEETVHSNANADDPDGNAWAEDLDIPDDDQVEPTDPVQPEPSPAVFHSNANDNQVEQSDPVQSEPPSEAMNSNANSDEPDANGWGDDLDIADDDQVEPTDPVQSDPSPEVFNSNANADEDGYHAEQSDPVQPEPPSEAVKSNTRSDEPDANAWGDDLDIADDNQIDTTVPVQSEPLPEAINSNANADEPDANARGDDFDIADDKQVDINGPVQSEPPPESVSSNANADEPDRNGWTDDLDMADDNHAEQVADDNHVEQSDPDQSEPSPESVNSNANAWGDGVDVMDDTSAEPNVQDYSNELNTENTEPSKEHHFDANTWHGGLDATESNNDDLIAQTQPEAAPVEFCAVEEEEFEPQKAATEVIAVKNSDDVHVKNVEEDVWAGDVNIREENEVAAEQHDQDEVEGALINRNELELADPDPSSLEGKAEGFALSEEADETVDNHLASEVVDGLAVVEEIDPRGDTDIGIAESNLDEDDRDNAHSNQEPLATATAQDNDKTDLIKMNMSGIDDFKKHESSVNGDSVGGDYTNDPWAEDDLDIDVSRSNEAENTDLLAADSADIPKEQPTSVTSTPDAPVPPGDSIEASSPEQLPSVSDNDPTADEVREQPQIQPYEPVRTELSHISEEKQSIALPPVQAAPKSSIFDAAPDISAATQSLQSVFDASNLFDTSKSSSMFGWSFPNAPSPNDALDRKGEDTPAVSEVLPSVEETVPSPPTETKAIDLYNDDELDDMYDDESDEDEEEDANVSSETHPSIETNEKADGRIPTEALPQHAVEKFVKQLERMTESHQLEMDELHRTYKNEIAQLQRELEEERTEKKKTKAREAVAVQDKHLSQMRDLEKTFNKTLQQKEEELQQVMQRNEGFTLKMDSMKREVDGLLKLVDERDDEICRLKQGHGNTLMKVEDSIKGNQQELSRKDTEIRDLKSSLASVQAELDSTTEHYNTLKSRAKAVATELKDRRIEVRTLTSQNEELTTANASLETELANLKSQNDQQQRTLGYKDKDIESLNEKIKALNKEVSSKDSLLQDRSSVGEKAISSYKRKAQEALAAANSRLAAANQAREEAESDAKAAKTASDDAVERARVAEAKRTEAERSASEATELLEVERSANLQAVADLQQAVDEMRETIESMRAELHDAESSKESLHSDIERTKSQLGEQRKLNAELRQKLLEAKDLCNSLQEEVHDLRDEAQRSSAAAFKRQKDDSLNETHKDGTKFGTNQRAESDGTIIMLQQELQGANDAIAELKLALRMALLEKAESSAADRKIESASAPIDQGHNPNETSHGNDSTPLFFAIEKQSELNTARDEINRLANMLGDAESEKQEAFDAMEKMRQEMEQANARLQRYEKLGMKSTRPPSASAVGYSSYRGAGHSNGTVSRENDSAVNLEYLKNVMLSYLNAKTLAERRKLVPVVATVLCLTPEEHSKAVQSVEESAGLGGVASSFWENLESKAHNLM